MSRSPLHALRAHTLSIAVAALLACEAPMEGPGPDGRAPVEARCDGGCPSGQVCQGSACIDLPAHCPCPVESYCDLAKDTCLIGCLDDSQCSLGRICDSSRRLCVAGCRTDSNCPSRMCDTARQTCLVSCQADGDCPAAQICDAARRLCVTGCRADSGCSAAQICDAQQFLCIPGCRTDGSCPATQICEQQRCVPGCLANRDCAATQICDLTAHRCLFEAATFTRQVSGVVDREYLKAIWASGPNDIYVGGDYPTMTGYGVLILHTKDGGRTWAKHRTDVPGYLQAMWGDGPNSLYLATNQGTIVKYELGFGVRNSVLDAEAQKVAGVTGLFAASGGVYGASAKGIVFWNGATLSRQSTSVVYRIWGTGPDDLYAVGPFGTILHSTNRGGTWTAQSSGSVANLRGIWGSGPSDVFVAGTSGAILHTANGGATWTRRSSASFENLYALWGSGPDDVYAVGDRGTLLHGRSDRDAFIPVASGSLSDLRAIWGSGRRDVYVIDTDSAILHGE